jgi:hypothetical protein
MCKRALIAVVATVAALRASPIAAQRPSDPDPRGALLLARAESLSRVAEAVDSARRVESIDRRRGQVLRSGRLTVVFWRAVSPDLGQRIVARADSLLEAFGGGLAEWLDHIVAVQLNSSDTARVLAAPSLRRRTVLELDWLSSKDSVQGALQIADQIGRRYRRTLDSAWQHWLPAEYGVVWQPKLEGQWALMTLTDPIVTTGSGCLAGRVSECRLWLALDRAARPVATRYRAADLRAQLRRSAYGIVHADRDLCLGGEDAACVRFAESYPVVSPIPAPDFARASVIRAIWVLHGPAAIARAFADTTGSVGERLARTAGVSEDSLVSEWRTWTLARGRRDRLAATLPQALGVIFAALLVVFLAARSGRWR